MKCGVLACVASWLITMPLYSQFSDDFSDGTLDAWQGDVSHFVVNPQLQLQLNAPSGTTQSWLYTPVSMSDSMVWEFYIKLDFAPSTSNQLRLYLGLNESDLTNASGYYLEIGASGDMDPVELKYLDQGIGKSLAASPGIAGAEPVELSLRIIRNSHGVWTCFLLGQPVPELLFTTSHAVISPASLGWFGLQCRYTDTRRDKFLFDDISIKALTADTTPPDLLSLEVLSATKIRLSFDEILDEASAMEPANFMLSPGAQQPGVIMVLQQEIELEFLSPFVSQQDYTLHVQGIRDVAGNLIEPLGRNFVYVFIDQAQADELLITEIMADPTPVIALPDAEYIEVYNASPHIFQLSDYTLHVGSSERALPDRMLLSGEYVILCDEENKNLLESFGSVLPISSMPALTNSGTRIALSGLSGSTIHEVSYTTGWYHDPDKSDGGWSLEMQNPRQVCREQDNWSAAVNLLGGTPGYMNSFWTETPDQDGPLLVSLFTPSPDVLQLRFDERLDALLMENPNLYRISPDIAIATAILTDPLTVELHLSSQLQAGIVYSLLPFDAFDCLGNEKQQADEIRFGLVATAEPGDLLVNEILFNPSTGGSRFIELINTSPKFINLGSIAIARLTPSGDDIFPTGLMEILAPGDIVVLSPSPEDILARFSVPMPQKLFSASVPSWDDQTDQVAILSGGMVIDSFTYQASWHHPVIADQNGVSLERISITAPSSSSSSWHSAAAIQGYGTPTGPNSQHLANGGVLTEPYTVLHPQFTPNGDGYKDFLALNFQLGSGDWIGTVGIFDLEGREIVRLASNDSFGSSAILQWDGRDASGGLAEMGMYVIFIQLWDVNGHLQEYQETCALVKR